MKNWKRLSSLLLVLAIMLVFAAPVFAQDVSAGDGPGSITINNASKGVTYTVYKVFDATYNETTDATAYTFSGTLSDNRFFTQNPTTGAIDATEAAKGSDGKLTAEAIAWLEENFVTAENQVKAATGGGSSITFTGLAYGYYIVKNDLKDATGSAVAINTVTSAQIINAKNSTEPTWDQETPGNGKFIVIDENGEEKYVKDTEVNIGDTVEFSLMINTSNYVGEKQIKEYIVQDKLPKGQTFVEIKSIKVGDQELMVTQPTIDADNSFKITIPWATQDAGADTWTSLYNAGALLEIRYTVTLNEGAVIDGDGNVNAAQFFWNFVDHDPEEEEPDGSSEEEKATVYTYALAIEKRAESEDGELLAGATFELTDAEGNPVKVSPTSDEDVYVVDEKGSNAVTTDEHGIIVIKGLTQGTYKVTETKAPDGYNKLNGAQDVKAEKTGQTVTTTTTYYDAEGNVIDQSETTETTVTKNGVTISALANAVINKKGAQMPSTGGIGTTIFYVVGGVLVIGAGVLLVTKKRMKN